MILGRWICQISFINIMILKIVDCIYIYIYFFFFKKVLRWMCQVSFIKTLILKIVDFIYLSIFHKILAVSYLRLLIFISMNVRNRKQLF